MLSGFYTAASGALTQQRNLNTISNNIANYETPGYRTERLVTTSFEDVLLRQENGQTVIGGGSPIRLVEDVMTNFDPNFLEETGRPYDLAINGEGYFHVLTGEGQEFMTRNGNFDIDEEGFLILRGVGQVIGQKGKPIKIGDSEFEVHTDGTVYSSKGKKLDTLKVTQPAEDVKLEKYTNGLFFVRDYSTNVPAEDVTIEQGLLESSNIDLNQEYTMAMASLRNFQLCSQALKIMDTLNQKTATQIASLT